MNLELITKQVANLSRSMGRYVRNELKHLKPKDVKEKGVNSLVTYVDRKSEQRLVSELSKILPEAGFIAEENDSYPRGDIYNWLVDPLDGTTNFVHGVPFFSISIALMKDNKILSGVVFEINHQECFYAWEGGKAYLNGQEIRVSETKELKSSLLATGFPYYDYSRLDAYIDLFKHFMKATQGVRRLGSAAVDLAYVACGRFEGFWEYGLNPWDVAAGSIIVEKAGGIIDDFRGTRNHVFGKEIIASNPQIYADFNRTVKGFLT